MTITGGATPRRLAMSGKLAVVGLVAVAVGLFIEDAYYRTAEVELAGGILRLFTSSGVYVAAARQTVYFGLTSESPLGLQMTPECTSAFLVLPLLVVGAVMIALRPRIARRVLFSLGVATVVLIVVNQIRILALVGLVNWLGTDKGYYWGHTLLGSMVSVFGGAVALVLFVWLATRRTKEERAAAVTGKRAQEPGA